MRGMMRRLKSSHQMMKNSNKVSASDFGGVANYDFYQFHTKKNPKDQTHEEQICDTVTEDTLNTTISYCSTVNKSNDNILHNTAARDDVSAQMMNDDNRCDTHETSTSKPLQKTETNIEIDNHKQSLRRLDKNLKENLMKSHGEMDPKGANILAQMGHIFLCRSQDPNNDGAAKDARRAKACFMVASRVFRMNSMQKEKQEALQNRNIARELEDVLTNADLGEDNSNCDKLAVDFVPTASNLATSSAEEEYTSDFSSRISAWWVDSLMGSYFLTDCCSHIWYGEGDTYDDYTMISSSSYTDATGYSWDQKSWDDY